MIMIWQALDRSSKSQRLWFFMINLANFGDKLSIFEFEFEFKLDLLER